MNAASDPGGMPLPRRLIPKRPNPLSLNEVIMATKRKRCASCKAVLETGQWICRACGEPVMAVLSPEAQEKEQEKQRKKWAKAIKELWSSDDVDAREGATKTLEAIGAWFGYELIKK